MALFVLVLLGLVLAVSLPFVGLIGNEWRHVVKAFIVLAICLIAIISFSYTYYFYSTEQLVEGYTDNLASAFGVSPLLAKAATFALLLPAGMALTWAFWSTDKTKRRRGQAILAGAAVFYFLALWVATKDQKVSRPGEALQCYVVTEQSVVWRDIRYRGTDPETGRPCEPAKPDILPTLARLDALLRSGRPLEPIDPKGHLFGSDRPPLWFSRTKDGGLEFYDVPAPDPRTRRPMQAVTEAVIAEWKRHEAEKAEAEQQKHLDHMRGLVLTGGSADLGLDIVPGRADNALDRLAAKRLPDLLSRTVPDTMHVASATFTDAFVKEGHFASAFGGDPTPLKETEVFTRVRRLGLGQTETACAPTGSVPGATSCRVTLLLKLFGEDGRIIDITNPVETGAAFSEEVAVEQGVAFLVKRDGSKIVQWVGR